MKLSEKINYWTHPSNRGTATLSLATLSEWAKDAEHLEQRWIPVSERMPEIDFKQPEYRRMVYCIVAYGDGTVGAAKWCSQGFAKTEKGRLPRWEQFDSDRLLFDNPIAWMPLPAPPYTVTPT